MIFSAHTLLTLLQALQLVALAPCLFIISFLLITSSSRLKVAVPCLYFAALACSFLLPLLELWPQLEQRHGVGQWIYGGLIFAQSLLPALSFLLIVQFATGNVPRPAFWAILALPVIGGSGVVYAALLADELCWKPVGCLASSALEGLYATFSNALIFLLLVAIFAHARKQEHKLPIRSSNRYWLIVALIGLNLLVMAVELLHIAEWMHVADQLFVATLLRMTFIYVVLTLLFRVFDRPADTAALSEDESAPMPSRRSPERERRDQEIIARFEHLMSEEQLYREMDCGRETVAKALEVSENMLSRIINQHYKLRFTEVVNQYRVKEAQRLLVINPEEPVTDIAFEVGFNSIPSFNRVFKESCGFSPTEYRNTRLAARKRGTI